MASNERDARLENAISAISELANEGRRLLSSLGIGANLNHAETESSNNPTATNSVIRANTSARRPVSAMLSMDRQRLSINQSLRNLFPTIRGQRQQSAAFGAHSSHSRMAQVATATTSSTSGAFGSSFR